METASVYEIKEEVQAWQMQPSFWIQLPEFLPHTGWVTLGKLYNLSKAQLPHYEMWILTVLSPWVAVNYNIEFFTCIISLTSMQWLTHICCHTVVRKQGTHSFQAISYFVEKMGQSFFPECSLSVLRGLGFETNNLIKQKKRMREKSSRNFTHTALLSATGNTVKAVQGIYIKF